MAKIKLFSNFFLLLSLSFVIDFLLSVFLVEILPKPLIAPSHLSLILLLFFLLKDSSWIIYFVYILTGIMTDCQYYHTFGISVFIFPLLVFLVKKHSGLIHMSITRFLLVLVIVTLFEVGTYFLAYVYGMTNYPINLLVAYQLMPSLVLNCLYVVLLNPLFQKITE